MEKGTNALQFFKDPFPSIIFYLLAGFLGGILIFHGAISFMLEEFFPEKVKVINLTESFPTLPEELSGVKIAFFADLHWKAGNEEHPLFLDLLAKLKAGSPDLILIGGDVADQFLKRVPEEKIRAALVPYLKKLHSPMGVYAVMGNHEAACGLLRYRKLFRESNIRVLEGEKVLLAPPGKREKVLELTGLPEKRYFRKNVLPPEKWKGEKEKENAFPLYFCHRPEVFDKLFSREKRPFLLLSAHYHGGLFAHPFLPNGYFINKRRKRPFAPYIYGAYRKRNSLLYVTSGLTGGYFRSRCRINLPRELLFLTLKKGEK